MMRNQEWSKWNKVTFRLLIVLIVSVLYILDIRTYTARVVAELTGSSVEQNILVISGGSRVLTIGWENSGFVCIVVLAFLFLITGDIAEFVISILIYFILNLGLLLVVIYAPEAYVLFWFYSAFSIVIAYVLGYYIMARVKHRRDVEKPMPPPPAESINLISSSDKK